MLIQRSAACDGVNDCGDGFDESTAAGCEGRFLSNSLYSLLYDICITSRYSCHRHNLVIQILSVKMIEGQLFAKGSRTSAKEHAALKCKALVDLIASGNAVCCIFGLLTCDALLPQLLVQLTPN